MQADELESFIYSENYHFWQQLFIISYWLKTRSIRPTSRKLMPWRLFFCDESAYESISRTNIWCIIDDCSMCSLVHVLKDSKPQVQVFYCLLSVFSWSDSLFHCFHVSKIRYAITLLLTASFKRNLFIHCTFLRSVQSVHSGTFIFIFPRACGNVFEFVVI